MLIGAGQLSAHIQKHIRKSIEDDGPTAILTQFGWSVVGKIPNFLVAGPSKKLCVNIHSVSQDEPLCYLVEQFHSTESFGTDVYAPVMTSAEDAKVIAVLESSAIFIGCGWQVDLPLRSEDFSSLIIESKLCLGIMGLDDVSRCRKTNIMRTNTI